MEGQPRAEADDAGEWRLRRSERGVQRHSAALREPAHYDAAARDSRLLLFANQALHCNDQSKQVKHLTHCLHNK